MKTGDVAAFPQSRREAPWTDYAGATIHEGDTIRHPSGEQGTVKFLEGYTFPSDQWRVEYEGSDGILLRLCLEIGDKGQAIVMEQTK